MRAATVSIEVTDPSAPAARAAVQRYFTEIAARFGFDATGLTARDAESLRPPGGTFLVAASDGAAVACGGVQTLEAGIGEIKRMWVDSTWRGAGLGARLLRELERHSRGLGHRAVRLDTNETLTEAIALYRRAGYREVERYNDNPSATHFFEKRLPEEEPEPRP